MFDFYQHRHIFFSLSIVLLLLGSILTFINGINLDIGFQGGAIMKYTYQGTPDLNEISQTVSDVVQRNVTIQTTTDLASNNQKLVLHLAGNDSLSTKEQAALDAALKEQFSEHNLQLSESNMVEPFIGKRSLKNGILAIILSFAFIVCYVWYRFKQISGLAAGLSGLIALVHDCALVFFTYTVFGLSINDTFIAVILTIIGYSINDTIVIFDRIRENAKTGLFSSPEELVNVSINQSLARTVNTALTTVASILILLVFAWVFNIESIRLFALPMAVGMISGCYSTIVIAGPLWVTWQKKKNVSYDMIQMDKRP